jgi:hypothetical protein
MSRNTNAVRVDLALFAGGVSNRDEFRSLSLSSSELMRFLLLYSMSEVKNNHVSETNFGFFFFASAVLRKYLCD